VSPYESSRTGFERIRHEDPLHRFEWNFLDGRLHGLLLRPRRRAMLRIWRRMPDGRMPDRRLRTNRLSAGRPVERRLDPSGRRAGAAGLSSRRRDATPIYNPVYRTTLLDPLPTF
jgi:hypothetical protein